MSKVNLESLSPELRAQVEKEMEKKTAQAGKAMKIRYRAAKRGLAAWERFQKFFTDRDQFITDLVEARDKYFELQKGMKETNSMTFEGEDKLFKVRLVASFKNNLNPELAIKAKEKIDEYVLVAQQDGEINDTIQELIKFLTAMFETKSKKLSWNWGVQSFIAQEYEDPRLLAAQGFLKQAVEKSEARYHLQFFTRSSTDKEYIPVPMNWHLTATAAQELIDRRKDERRSKRKK